MNEPITIQIVYPKTEGRIVLRTDDNWEKDIEPAWVGDDRNCTEFRYRSEKPYFYFKPMLVRGKQRLFSQAQYIAIMNSKATREVYPHFFPDPENRVVDRVDVTSSKSVTHQIRVFTPPGYYENTLKRFPVIYMQDGQNLFFPEEAFAGQHWRIEETLTILNSMNIIRKSIVVGIYPADRLHEYTKPGYEDYGRFIVEDLKPTIDRENRTLTGPEETAVMGSSLGGVVSFYLAWNYPHIFGKAACMSSTFNFRDDLLQRVLNEEKKPVKLYLDSGWPEDNYEVTRSMNDVLLRRGFQSGLDLLYFAFPHALHNERYWAMRSHIPFQFFFGKGPTS